MTRRMLLSTSLFSFGVSLTALGVSGVMVTQALMGPYPPIYRGKGLGWRIGRISQLITPGLACCEKCRTTWAFVPGHVTHLVMGQNGMGMFPLCEACWSEMTADQRLPYYLALWRQWKADADRYGYQLDQFNNEGMVTASVYLEASK